MSRLGDMLSYPQAKALSSYMWSLKVGERLVKVVSAGGGPFTYGNPLNPPSAIGYVTQEYYITGKTPMQIEMALGLPPFQLDGGAIVFALMRLPNMNEFEYRYSAERPGGKPFDREKYLNDRSKVMDRYWDKVYPPGEDIPQWEVTAIIPLRKLQLLLSGQIYDMPSVS